MRRLWRDVVIIMRRSFTKTLCKSCKVISHQLVSD
jgi:hypothetical protein